MRALCGSNTIRPPRSCRRKSTTRYARCWPAAVRQRGPTTAVRTAGSASPSHCADRPAVGADDAAEPGDDGAVACRSTSADAAQVVQQHQAGTARTGEQVPGGPTRGTSPAPTKTRSTWSACCSSSSCRTATCRRVMQALLGRLQIPYPESGHPRSAPVCAKGASGAAVARPDGAGMHGLVGGIRPRPSPVRQGEETRSKSCSRISTTTWASSSARASTSRTSSKRNKKRSGPCRAARRRSHARTRETAPARRIRRCGDPQAHRRRQLPDDVHSVLTRPWANYLVLTLLRQGEESKEWQQALRFADEFAWSAEPKNNDADRTRLQRTAAGRRKASAPRPGDRCLPRQRRQAADARV